MRFASRGSTWIEWMQESPLPVLTVLVPIDAFDGLPRLAPVLAAKETGWLCPGEHDPKLRWMSEGYAPDVPNRARWRHVPLARRCGSSVPHPTRIADQS